MGSARLLVLAVLVFFTAAPCGAFAQSEYYVYFSDNISGGDFCTRILDSAPTVRQIYVFVSTPGATAVEFSAPLPECVIGATYLSDTFVFPVTLGNSQTGVSIGFGTCQTGSATHVLTINCMMQGLTEECCLYRVLPHPYADPPEIYFQDCNYDLIVGRTGHTFVVKTPGTRLDNPNPPDGAVDQPLDVRLSWTEHHCDCNFGFVCIDVYFGNNPDPPLVAQLTTEPYEFPYDPGPLQPSTPYYWKLKSYGPDAPWMSPVWSFSTKTGVPTESTSWGAIKALYRD